jgi:hypothetical protein
MAEDDKDEMTLEQAMAELTRVKEALKTANDESASRRHKIKELEDSITLLQDKGKTDEQKKTDRTAELEQKLTETSSRLRVHDLRRAFETEADAKEYQFAGRSAFEDAFTIALPLLQAIEVDPDDGSVPKKTVREVLEKVLEGRQYLLADAKKKAPDNDAGKKGAPRELTEEEIIRRKKQDSAYQRL